ncbi:hypothetical protein [Terrisporobacter sp.]|uniref:hypothetical protein n=1 Tax=Terrisporobacter sp. TaxID=1965305 RepID=UPI00261FA281|nr:hypothetical protein [Terrisporobacter sp.]
MIDCNFIVEATLALPMIIISLPTVIAGLTLLGLWTAGTTFIITSLLDKNKVSSIGMFQSIN